MLCLLVYCISINQKSDISVTVIYHAMSLSMIFLYQYHSAVSVSKKSDISVTVVYHAMSLTLLCQYH